MFCRRHTAGKVGQASLSASYSAESFTGLGKPAICKIKVDTDGDIYVFEDPPDSYVSRSTWLVQGAASDFEVRMTLSSGTDWDSGPSGWVGLTVDREWTASDSAGGGSQSGTFTLEIRDKYSLEVHDTASVDYFASSSF